MAIATIITDYALVQDKDPVSFTNKVMSFVDQGYTVWGSPSFLYDGINFMYIQAMIKEHA